MRPMNLFRLGIFAVVATASTACTFESSSGGYGNAGNAGPSEPVLVEDAGEPALVSGGSSKPSTTSMLVRVDPSVKMNAAPGQGVGVFTEYDAGGHWHLWWTCDTSLTSQTCLFDVKVTVEQGAIVNAVADQFTSSDVLTMPSTPGPGEAGGIEAKTMTTTATEGVLFDTDPGATITLLATVGGLYNGQFLFWVQGGQVKGGYTGTVTDPLMLVGATP
jgi:hypothetical protein